MLKLLTNKDYPDPFWPTVFVVIGFLVVLTLLRLAWRIIKEDNIFNNTNGPHYAHRETEAERTWQTGHGKYLFEATLVTNAMFLLNLVVSVKLNGEQVVNYISSLQALPKSVLGLAPVLAMFIYSTINESVFTFLFNFKYVLKVWLLSIILLSVFLSIALVGYIHSFERGVIFYSKVQIFVNGSGCITFAALAYGAHFTSLKFKNKRDRKLWLSVLVQVVILGNVALINYLCGTSFIFGFGSWLISALTFQFAIHLFTMDGIIHTDESATVAQIISDEQPADQLA